MLHANLKSNIDCFKLFARASIVLICGINLAQRLCPRSECHTILFSGFCLDIEKAAVPAKWLLPILCNFEGRMRKHINDFTMRVDSSHNILIAMLTDNSFVHAGPLREKWVRSEYVLYKMSVVTVDLYTKIFK